VKPCAVDCYFCLGLGADEVSSVLQFVCITGITRKKIESLRELRLACCHSILVVLWYKVPTLLKTSVAILCTLWVIRFLNFCSAALIDLIFSLGQLFLRGPRLSRSPHYALHHVCRSVLCLWKGRLLKFRIDTQVAIVICNMWAICEARRSKVKTTRSSLVIRGRTDLKVDGK